MKVQEAMAAHKLGQALFLAGQGMHVFPLIPGRRIPLGGCDDCNTRTRTSVHRHEDCPCIPAGRHCHGAHAATTDPETIARWWTGRNAAAGIGIHLAKSGLVMLDIDAHGGELKGNPLPTVANRITSSELVPADGWDSMALLCAERGAEEPWNDESAVRVATPSGGLHVWYRATDADQYRNIDGKLAWQVDVKAGPAFAVAPGTEVHGKGSYLPMGSWGDGPSELPAWLAREIRAAGGLKPATATPRFDAAARFRQGSQPGLPEAFRAKVMQAACESVAGAPSGQRNAALNRAAFRVGKALLTRDPSLREELGNELEMVAVEGGTPAHEARATVASGLDAGSRSL